MTDGQYYGIAAHIWLAAAVIGKDYSLLCLVFGVIFMARSLNA